MGILKWLLKKLGFLKEEKPQVEITKLRKPPEEIQSIIPKGYTFTEGYRIKLKPKTEPRYHVKLKFKPRTAHEKRLWKPDKKPEEGENEW